MVARVPFRPLRRLVAFTVTILVLTLCIGLLGIPDMNGQDRLEIGRLTATIEIPIMTTAIDVVPQPRLGPTIPPSLQAAIRLEIP